MGIIVNMLTLPVSESLITRCQLAERLDKVLFQCSTIELVGLVTLVQMGSFPAVPDSLTLEKAQASLLADCVGMAKSEVVFLACQLVTREGLQQGLARLGSQARLMNDEELAARNYLTPEGSWRFGYAKPPPPAPILSSTNQWLAQVEPRVRRTTDEQDRLLNQLKSNPDEGGHVEGFAGTGKTHLIVDYLTLIAGSSMNKVVLTQTQEQSNALFDRLPAMAQDNHLKGLTFMRLMREILWYQGGEKYHTFGHDWDREKGVNAKTLAKTMGYPEMEHLNPYQVALTVLRTLGAWCNTTDAMVTADHVVIDEFSPVIREQMAALTANLWDVLIDPKQDNPIPVRSYHMVKLVHQENMTIPPAYDLMIIDESHDLSRPLQEIFTRSPQAVLSFGDVYQNLAGKRGLQPPAWVRKNYLDQSIRAGSGLEPVVSEILSTHPRKQEHEFRSNRDIKTEVTYYQKFQLPHRSGTLILSRSLWQVFEIIQRLVAAKAPFHILPATRSQVRWLINDAITLFEKKGRATHPLLLQHSVWKGFVGGQQSRLLFRIDDLFEKGFTHADWERSIAASIQKANAVPAGAYRIGLIAHAKNWEFDQVMITPEVVEQDSDQRGALTAQMNQLYTGLSRTRRQLWLPISFQEQLEKCRKMK